MNKFLNDIKKYKNYIKYSVTAELNSEVANSYLGWLWWVLDPLFFMLIYTFISVMVFKSKEPNFPVFVFIALILWNFFNFMMVQSTRLVTNNKDTVTKIYIPKHILIINKMGVYLFKTFISFCLIVMMMIFFKVPFSFHIFEIIPVFASLIIVTFGFSTVLTHYGVFVEDLSNFTNILLKLVFYLSGIFYLVSKQIPSPYSDYLLIGNPMAFLIESARNVLLYAKSPNYLLLGLWTLIGIGFSIIGIKTIYKYENSYVKVIK